jgi:TolB-like protein/DNA-binding winged helix-turn-helix (wHTH) protein
VLRRGFPFLRRPTTDRLSGSESPVATSPEPAHTDQPPVTRFGGFELDLQSGVLSRNGTKNRLQGQPLQLLELLLQQPDRLVTRAQIQQHLWPDGTVVEFEHSVNAAVKRLREALGDDAERPTFIETIPRKGYRLLPPVESVKPVKREMFQRYLIVAVIFIVMVGLSIAYVRFRPLPSRIHSLAVLPFKNLSGDSTQEYLADGMTEALIGRLSRIHDLRVISRTSVMRFKDTKPSVPEIARTLGVDAIVEGSVIREGSRIRVNAQLIRAATDDHFWSEAYDRELPDTLALESDVAQSIARRVEVTVTGEEHARLVAAHHISPEVYESYLKAEDEFGRSNSRAEIEKSITYFEETIGKDANFAPAYVGLASVYDRLGTLVVGAPPNEVRTKLISAARKALELDPELAEPHVLLAGVYQKQWQWSDAEAEYKLALELNPNDAGAHERFAVWLLCQGRTDEALEWAQRAHELDPLGGAGRTSGFILFHARRYDEAIRELRPYPDHWYLGFALIANGQPDAAITVLEKALSGSDRGSAVMGVLVRAYAHAGRRAEALRLLDELKRRQQKSYVPSAAFVNAYLGLGDNEQAFAWLEKAYQEQSNILGLLKVHPYFDPLRGDPRFKELVHRVRLD